MQLARRNRRDIGPRDVIEGARLAHALYRSLPSFPTMGSRTTPSVAQIVRASHELKNISHTAGLTCSITTATLILVNAAITQGTSASNRTGRKVIMEKLRLSMNFEVDPHNSYDYTRVIVFVDKESRGGLATISDLLTDTGSQEALILSSFNEDNKNRFRIVSDSVHNLPQTNNTGGSWFGGIRHYDITVPLKHKVDFYNTTAGTIADIDQGALFVYVAGFSTNYGTAADYHTQLWFRDV
jgi:hypothetical protein